MLKRIVAAIIIVTIFIGMWMVLAYLLIDDAGSYTRKAYHEFYDQAHIDTVFIGASHCSRSFHVPILDERLGENTFNLGSSSQGMDTSYLIAQEAIARYHVKRIVLETSYNVATYNIHKKRSYFQDVYIVTDYLKPSLRKYLFLLDASDSKYYANSFFPARRNWDKMFEEGYIGEILKKKETDAYKTYGLDFVQHDTEKYIEKGYVASDKKILNNAFISASAYYAVSIDDIQPEWTEYLKKIISLCDEKGVELLLVSTPLPPIAVYGRSNYDAFIEYVNSIIAGKNVTYLDYNLLKERYWPDNSELFMDNTHLNNDGAVAFSNIFADYLTGAKTGEELFYHSIAEKYISLPPAVYGVIVSSRKDGENAFSDYEICTNSPGKTEFRITMKSDDQGEYMVQEFDENTRFSISDNEHGLCTIVYRFNTKPNDIYTMEIPY